VGYRVRKLIDERDVTMMLLYTELYRTYRPIRTQSASLDSAPAGDVGL